MRLLLRFSLPMLVGNIFQQFYSMVDAMIVGRFVGVDALAAVGATGGMSFLVLGFVIGLANGFCVVVSQRFGARDEAGLRRCVAMTMLLSLIVTAVATAASFLGTEPMLRAMNTPENIFSDSAAYIGIIFLGLGASLFYNLFSGLLRAVGDSKTPLYFLCLSSALNVVLDLLFVVTFSMGVAGAAWATILSQGVSALLCLVYMLKKFPILRTGRADWAWHGPMVRRLARMGIPTALSNSVTAIGCMILQVTINGFGSTVVAAYTAASKVEQLTTQPTFTFGLAAATFTAQNAGAGKLDRVKDGVRKATVLNLIAGLAAAVVVWLFAAPITTWFVDPGETAVIAASVQFLNIEAVFILALGVLFVYRNALQGLGNAVMPLISGGVELAMRLAAAILLSRFLGYVGVCLANPVAWTGAAVMLVPPIWPSCAASKTTRWPAPAEAGSQARTGRFLAKTAQTGRKPRKATVLFERKRWLSALQSCTMETLECPYCTRTGHLRRKRRATDPTIFPQGRQSAGALFRPA